jgi:hypothetical protein
MHLTQKRFVPIHWLNQLDSRYESHIPFQQNRKNVSSPVISRSCGLLIASSLAVVKGAILHYFPLMLY